MLYTVRFDPKEKSAPKQHKIIEQSSKNTMISYLEASLPFPLTNRDFVQKKLCLSKKEDSDLIKKLGVQESSQSQYYIFITEPTEHKDYPEKKSPVRAKVINYVLIEELSTKEIRITSVSIIDLGGNLSSAQDKMLPKSSQDILEKQLADYSKFIEASK